MNISIHSISSLFDANAELRDQAILIHHTNMKDNYQNYYAQVRKVMLCEQNIDNIKRCIILLTQMIKNNNQLFLPFHDPYSTFVKEFRELYLGNSQQPIQNMLVNFVTVFFKKLNRHCQIQFMNQCMRMIYCCEHRHKLYSLMRQLKEVSSYALCKRSYIDKLVEEYRQSGDQLLGRTIIVLLQINNMQIGWQNMLGLVLSYPSLGLQYLTKTHIADNYRVQILNIIVQQISIFTSTQQATTQTLKTLKFIIVPVLFYRIDIQEELIIKLFNIVIQLLVSNTHYQHIDYIIFITNIILQTMNNTLVLCNILMHKLQHNHNYIIFSIINRSYDIIHLHLHQVNIINICKQLILTNTNTSREQCIRFMIVYCKYGSRQDIQDVISFISSNFHKLKHKEEVKQCIKLLLTYAKYKKDHAFIMLMNQITFNMQFQDRSHIFRHITQISQQEPSLINKPILYFICDFVEGQYQQTNNNNQQLMQQNTNNVNVRHTNYRDNCVLQFRCSILQCICHCLLCLQDWYMCRQVKDLIMKGTICVNRAQCIQVQLYMQLLFSIVKVQNVCEERDDEFVCAVWKQITNADASQLKQKYMVQLLIQLMVYSDDKLMQCMVEYLLKCSPVAYLQVVSLLQIGLLIKPQLQTMINQILPHYLNKGQYYRLSYRINTQQQTHNSGCECECIQGIVNKVCYLLLHRQHKDNENIVSQFMRLNIDQKEHKHRVVMQQYRDEIRQCDELGYWLRGWQRTSCSRVLSRDRKKHRLQNIIKLL